MCGIAAQYGRIDLQAGDDMLIRLSHRGPDDIGRVSVSDHAWLGHTRLSIVDLSGGSQPLGAGDGNEWLVGNGEVYNHEQVRQTLDGEVFTTRSDNEVALHLLKERGPDALGELAGMWAFLAAGTDGTFVAARDPVGIKPLYWARRPVDEGVEEDVPSSLMGPEPDHPGTDDIRFASEMRAFSDDWLPDVEAFPPGCYWTPETGLVRFAQAVPESAIEVSRLPGPTEPGAEIPDDILRQTREVLVDSVDRHMMADVDVGVFLSGGLDSSLIAAIAADYLRPRGRTLKTFAVGTEGSPDLLAARRVADFLGTDHYERTYTAEDAAEVLPESIRTIESFDPGLVRSAVPNYLLARFTAEHVKVVLTGEGADELFAGYDYYHQEFEDAEELHSELVRTVKGLHNLNLQRCDRVTMAHGLEARVPFLDLEVIAHALHLPPGWKLAGEGQLEKRLLRLAFDGWLPEDLLWREKQEFGDGSGAADVLSARMEASISDRELELERTEVDPPLRTKEELAYYRIFREHLPHVAVQGTVGRFARA